MCFISGWTRIFRTVHIDTSETINWHNETICILSDQIYNGNDVMWIRHLESFIWFLSLFHLEPHDEY